MEDDFKKEVIPDEVYEQMADELAMQEYYEALNDDLDWEMQQERYECFGQE